jgi:hypothetical protein
METGMTKNGKDYARFTIAVYQGKDKDGMFIPCIMFGKPIEWVNIEKGDIVAVAGSLSTQKSDEYGLSLTLFCDDVRNYTKTVIKKEGISQKESDCPF